MPHFLSHPPCAPFTLDAKPNYAGFMIATFKQRKNISKSCGCDFLQPELASSSLAHYLLPLHAILLHSLIDSQESSYLFCWLTHTRPKQEWEEEKNEHTAALAQDFQKGRAQGCFLLY
jgi:hypothetical protein